MRWGSRRRHVSAATLGGAATTWRKGRQSVALTCRIEGRKLQVTEEKGLRPWSSPATDVINSTIQIARPREQSMVFVGK